MSNGYFFKELFKNAQLLARVIFVSVSLMRENLRGLRETLKYKIRAIDSKHQDVGGDLNHICSECGKGFIYKRSLMVHNVLFHKGDKPYYARYKENMKFKKPKKPKESNENSSVDVECKFCERRLKADRLTSHIRFSHPNQYFEERTDLIHCTQCDDKFSGKRGENE